MIIEPVGIAAILTAVTAAIFAYLGWRRTQGIDAATKQVAEDSKQAAHNTQSFDELKGINQALQADNKVLRDHQVRMEERIETIQKRLDAVETGNNALVVRNRELEREIVELHAENAVLRRENEALGRRISELESK